MSIYNISDAFSKQSFLQPQDVLKVCTFGPTLGPIYPMKESEIEKSKYFQGKNLFIGLSKYPKINTLSALNFQRKIQLLFALFGVFWGQKRAQKSKIKAHRPG